MLLVRGKVEAARSTLPESATGLKLMDSNGIKDGAAADHDVPQPAARASTIELQGILFGLEQLLTARIEGAIASSTLDAGLETLSASFVVVVDRQTIYTHPRTGAETNLLTIQQAQAANRPVA